MAHARMRVIFMQLQVLSCTALNWGMPHTSEDGSNTTYNTDPDVEVGPVWIRHRQQQSPTDRQLCEGAVAVCIVGQLSRLETKSKMDNLFNFMASVHKPMHVFVVADVDSNFYVNPGLGDPTCGQDFPAPADVAATFSPFYQAGSYLKSSSGEVVPILPRWGTTYGSDKPKLNRTKRIMAHFRQWTHVSECAKLIKEHEAFHGCKYDGFMKLRDNGIVTKPMRVVVREQLVVKHCCGMGGVNDKFLLAPRKYLDQVFQGPLEVATQVNKGIVWAREFIQRVKNPEQFWDHMFSHHHVQVVRSSDYDSITVVDGRCLKSEAVKGGTWCLVPSEKDCHPKDVLGYAECRRRPHREFEHAELYDDEDYDV
mmetsp:Transcript_85592/g.223371  ORF Transcript_85592/g.223371 Transcript_85592/m.223371 type:complete len:367 (+) Transcript_85592:114-1214(+)